MRRRSGSRFFVDPGHLMAIREAPYDFNCGDSGTTTAAHAATAFSFCATVSSVYASSRGPCSSIAKFQIEGSSADIGARASQWECSWHSASSLLQGARSASPHWMRNGRGNWNGWQKGNQRLRQIVANQQVVPPPDSSSEVEQLRMQVAQLQHELGQVGEAPCGKRQAVVPQARTVRLREDFVPVCDADILQWMQDRQADLQDASHMGNVSEVTRLFHVIGETASGISTQWPKARMVPIWGFRGVRVGEASNPGPTSKRRRTQRLRVLQRPMDSDSEDDVPLVSTGPEVFAMSDALEQDLCQIEAEDQPIATRKDSEDD